MTAADGQHPELTSSAPPWPALMDLLRTPDDRFLDLPGYPWQPVHVETAAPDNQRAWRALAAWDKPFLCAFSDQDPITRGAERGLIARIPGAAGQPHVSIGGAGHFLQEDAGEELARVVADWVRSPPR